MNRVKRSRFEKFCVAFGSFSIALSLIAGIVLNGMKYDLATKTQRVESEIVALQNEIDSLDMEKQKLVSFSRLSQVASEHGYVYHQEAVASVGNVGFAE